MSGNVDWISRDLEVLWHPCTQMSDHEWLPLVPIVSGSGCWLTDAEGQRYFDAISSWWVNLFGHAQPHISEAVAEQAQQLEHVILAGFTHVPAITLAERLLAHYGGSLAGKTIAVWGLAFKPETDDMREAPARNLLAALWAAGARVQAHDPAAMQEARRIFGERPDLLLCDSPEAALQGADALAIMTEWKQFRVPDFALLARSLKDRMVFDGRNLYDPAVVARHGLGYVSIGRQPVTP